MKTILIISLSIFVNQASLGASGSTQLKSEQQAGAAGKSDLAYRRPFITDVKERVLRGMENSRIRVLVA